MNKTKRIIAIMLIIYIVFNYLYSVNANEEIFRSIKRECR